MLPVADDIRRAIAVKQPEASQRRHEPTTASLREPDCQCRSELAIHVLCNRFGWTMRRSVVK